MKDSEGYKRLERVCEIAKSMTKDMRFTVEDTYLDYGQNWVWTTVIATNFKNTCHTPLRKFD